MTSAVSQPDDSCPPSLPRTRGKSCRCSVFHSLNSTSFMLLFVCYDIYRTGYSGSRSQPRLNRNLRRNYQNSLFIYCSYHIIYHFEAKYQIETVFSYAMLFPLRRHTIFSRISQKENKCSIPHCLFTSCFAIIRIDVCHRSLLVYFINYPELPRLRGILWNARYCIATATPISLRSSVSRGRS